MATPDPLTSALIGLGIENLGIVGQVISFTFNLFLFLVIQVFIFGQIYLLVRGYLIVKGFLERVGIIPRVKEVLG